MTEQVSREEPQKEELEKEKVAPKQQMPSIEEDRDDDDIPKEELEEQAPPELEKQELGKQQPPGPPQPQMQTIPEDEEIGDEQLGTEKDKEKGQQIGQVEVEVSPTGDKEPKKEPEKEEPELEEQSKPTPQPQQVTPPPPQQRRANPPPQRRVQSVGQDRQQQLMNQYSAPQQEMGEEKPKKRRGLMVAAFLAPGLTKRYLQAKMMLAQYEQIKMQREAMAGNRGNYKLARQIDNVDLRRTLQQKQQQMGMIQGQRQQHQGHQMQQLGMTPQQQQMAPQQHQQEAPKQKKDLGAFKKAQQQKGLKGRGDR